jgi:hypothetical protein
MAVRDGMQRALKFEQGESRNEENLSFLSIWSIAL